MDLVKKSGKYLGKSDFSEDGGWYTIATVEDEVIKGTDDTTENKYVAYFDEFDKGLILNEGNRAAIVESTGTVKVPDMIGKKVNVYVDPDVMYAGKVVGGVKIRRKAYKA